MKNNYHVWWLWRVNTNLKEEKKEMFCSRGRSSFRWQSNTSLSPPPSLVSPMLSYWNLPRVGWLWKTPFWRTSHSTDAATHSPVGDSVWKKTAATQKYNSKILLKTKPITFKLENNLVFLNNSHHPPAFAQCFFY